MATKSAFPTSPRFIEWTAKVKEAYPDAEFVKADDIGAAPRGSYKTTVYAVRPGYERSVTGYGFHSPTYNQSEIFKEPTLVSGPGTKI